jgi:hypothetical protein
MKVNDIVQEGLFGDLRALGQANQAELKQSLSGIKGQLTPSWYEKLAGKVAQAKSSQQTGQLANAWSAAWDKEFKNIETAHGKPFTDDEYRGLFRSWLEKAAKVNVDDAALKQYVSVQSPEAVKQYFTQHFIPGYLKAQSNPMRVIPNGTTVNTQTTVGRKTSQVKYTWDSSKGRFVDGKGAEVPTYTQLHTDLLQQAMDQAAAASTGVATVGGGGAATV